MRAAPQFSLEPKTWWYPVLGRLAYRGYFSEKSAQECGDRLRKEGFDVYVDGVDAYSTLGWFKDPILNTFLDSSESELAELLFHELAHQRVFVNGDTDFNEAFATTVGQEGTRRWLRTKGNTLLLQQYNDGLVRDQQFVHLVMSTRERLEKLYGTGGKQLPADEMNRQKRRIYDDLLHEYADLKGQWGGYAGYDNWFSQQLNNAKLNTIANYNDFVPGFEALLRSNAGDMEKFYDAARRLGKTPLEERHRQLRESPLEHP